jgi:hypothetical protein
MTAQQRQLLALLTLPMAAVDLAHLLGWPHEVTYQELVALEAQGKVKVRIDYAGHQITFKGWVAA